MAIVLISGGTGLIGKKLTSYLIDRNYEVIILSRHKNESSSNPKISYSFWDIKKQEIDADIPMSELYGYSTDLRSITGGIGEYSYEFTRYEQAPSDVQQKVIEENAKEEETEAKE